MSRIRAPFMPRALRRTSAAVKPLFRVHNSCPVNGLLAVCGRPAQSIELRIVWFNVQQPYGADRDRRKARAVALPRDGIVRRGFESPPDYLSRILSIIESRAPPPRSRRGLSGLSHG